MPLAIIEHYFYFVKWVFVEGAHRRAIGQQEGMYALGFDMAFLLSCGTPATADCAMVCLVSVQLAAGAPLRNR